MKCRVFRTCKWCSCSSRCQFNDSVEMICCIILVEMKLFVYFIFPSKGIVNWSRVVRRVLNWVVTRLAGSTCKLHQVVEYSNELQMRTWPQSNCTDATVQSPYCRGQLHIRKIFSLYQFFFQKDVSALVLGAFTNSSANYHWILPPNESTLAIVSSIFVGKLQNMIRNICSGWYYKVIKTNKCSSSFLFRNYRA